MASWRNLDGFLVSAKDFTDLPSFTFTDTDKNGVSKARLNLTEICQKCGVTYSIIQNIHPPGKSTYQAQFHCKDVVEQKRLKAVLALSLEEKECYNKTEFDMKWRELSLTPDDYVFTLTSNETYTLLGYSNSQNLLGEYLKAAPKRGSAGDTTEYKFEDGMKDAASNQNYLLDTFSKSKFQEYKRKPIVDGIQALDLFQKAAQVVNAKTFGVDVDTGIIFDCNSEADVYRLESLLMNQVTNNGFWGFREYVKIESTETGYRLTLPPANIPRLLGFDDSLFNHQLKFDLDTCKTIISNIKGTYSPLEPECSKRNRTSRTRKGSRCHLLFYRQL